MLLPELNLAALTEQIEWAEASEKMMIGLADAETLARFQGWGIWDQDMWAEQKTCGTAYCQAGQAALQDGWKMYWASDVNTTSACFKEIEGHNVVESIPLVAREYLGLSPVEANTYFAMSNDLHDLRQYVNDMAWRRGLEPPYNVEFYPIDKETVEQWESDEGKL